MELPHRHHREKHFNFLYEQLQNMEHFQVVSKLFHQLADTNRIRLFWFLCHGEECVIYISSLMEMSSPAVSYHLKALRDTGLIVSRRASKEVYYKAADTPESQLLYQMIEQMLAIICPQEERGRK